VLTLGTCKVTLLLSRGDGTVDVAAEGSIAEVADVVVGLDVFLNSLTAVGAKSAGALGKHDAKLKDSLRWEQLTLIHCAP